MGFYVTEEKEEEKMIEEPYYEDGHDDGFNYDEINE